jgi:hypothetical protein
VHGAGIEKSQTLHLPARNPESAEDWGKKSQYGAGGMANDLLASRHKALSSNLSTAKNIKGE